MADEVVLSEVHVGYSEPLDNLGWGVTEFRLRCAGDANQKDDLEIDGDGDVLVPRKGLQDAAVLVIRHRLATPLHSVGLQVWSGALLMADFILHRPDLFSGCRALELGAGVGFVGLALARVARRVYLTDHIEDILLTCKSNVDLNRSTFEHGPGTAFVRHLSWVDDVPGGGRPPPARAGQMPPVSAATEHFQWSEDDQAELTQLDYLIAADTVYEDDLTDAFVRTATRLMQRVRASSAGRRQPVLYAALEKRINFTLDDLDAVAPAYDHFLGLFLDSTETASTSRMHADQQPSNSKRLQLLGNRIFTDQIPQSYEYQRTADLELWEIRLMDVT